MKRYGLRDDQFARIENLLPGRPGTVGRNSDRGNRLFVEAVIWKFRAGAPWRDLPERFGGWSNTHRRFSRWAEKGVWENLFKALADDPDNEYAMIDATIGRAHQHSAGARKKGVATRPSAARTAGSRPKSMLAISLTGGQVHDITQAEALVALVEPEALLADKGYDADHFVERLKVRAIKPVIPPKSNRKIKRDCDFALYAERNLVERFFNIIKHFRAIATRYEKTARNFLAGLHLVCALDWLK